ncbi:diguanylate cyclase domain-containing protein [Methylogaea oryzae]|uniref:diguanylate cyclase domain-containing protein n=1 Tax=Methylogaea oryzae TaxID=1295382 RepID=UPI0006CFBD2B|nr:diguanylate cyclase [Methylogaea oryzae]
MITDAKGEIVEANNSYCTLTGYSQDELRGRNPRLLKSGAQDATFYQDMWRSLLENGYWHGDLWNRRADGELYAQLTRISAIYGDKGEVLNYICLATDITAVKNSQLMLEKMAYLDPLTQLPNRTLLADRMQQIMAQCRRDETLLAVCYLDLDGFKPVNDRWGHAAGDALLIAVAQRLREAVRSGDTVARIGGDEFVVLLGGLDNTAACDLSLRRVHEAIQRPFTLDQGVAQISASLGVSLFPKDSSDPDTLLRNADQAMYQAKQAGRNRIHLFDPERDRQARVRLEAQANVREALARGEYLLHYQPKVDMGAAGSSAWKR